MKPQLRLFSLFALLIFLAAPSWAQDLTLELDQRDLTLEVGEKGTLTARLLDANGAVVEETLRFFSRDRKVVAVDRWTGEMTALAPGEASVGASYRSADGRLSAAATVTVPFPEITEVVFADAPVRVYEGTRIPLRIEVIDAAGMSRSDVEIRLLSTDGTIAIVDPFHYLTAAGLGTAGIMAEAEGARGEITVEVVPNPVVRLGLTATRTEARTGDVVTFTATAFDATDAPVADAPIHYAAFAQPTDDLGPGASAQIGADGRFVAEQPGLYTVVAASGPYATQHTVRINPREASQRVEFIGHGRVQNEFTSDLWVWEGADGRDYALTGTWSANGAAYFWDVTDPGNPAIIDTVTVDARTVNDVKVSEDGSVCVISREGASNRKNGLVILDCSDPSDVKTLAAYDDELTGGVHNVFIADGHIYAVNNGQRYDIIDIADPANPRRVGRFELDTPGHSIHDVWVEDGIAYSSNWGDGVYMVDVGNGIKGGSVENPVVIGHYAYPSGWNHAAFPYKNEETGKFYIIAGDEAFPYDNVYDDAPEEAAGWMHFIDFTDPENPKEVARYEVPEAGTHNFWVEDDKLYIGYYDGGLRIVDISGDLMGDLYQQGREVARFMSFDPQGHVPNAAMVWGVQPHKGYLFFADHYSGLWVVKLAKEEKKPGT